MPNNPWVRYADDACIHATSKAEAEYIHEKLEQRMKEIGLELSSEKTRIVYCKDANRGEKHTPDRFVFLGFEFAPREARSRTGLLFLSFLPAVSKQAMKKMRHHIKYKLALRYRVDLSLAEIAKMINPVVRGWLNYYGASYTSSLYSLYRYINDALARWAQRKFKRLNRGRRNAYDLLKKAYATDPRLFVHWKHVRP